MTTPDPSAARVGAGARLTLANTTMAIRIERPAAAHAEASIERLENELGVERRTGTPTGRAMDRIKDAFAHS
jgi:hypothetical protein